MRIPLRAASCLALAGWLGLAGLSSPAVAAAPAEKSFPDSTLFYFKVTNSAGLREAFAQSQLGQLWADPAFKPFREDLAGRFEERSKALKAKIGVTIPELLTLPQGPIAVALVPCTKDDAPNPVAIVLTADAGKNAATMTEVLTKASQQGEEAGARVTKEEFKGLTLSTIQSPRAKDFKEGDPPPPPLIWANEGSLFYVGTDVDSLKDVIGHASGRPDSIEASDVFAQVTKKVGADAQALYFADLGKILAFAVKAGAQGKNAANVEQINAISQVLGLNGLKAIAGSYALNTGPFDSVTKTFVLVPAPLQGVLKLLALPKVSLKPEPWVPATVASYQSVSVDLDAVYTGINDLANMFQPGVLNVLEQQLVGPNGGEPISFKKDIFGPIGDRITMISDFKKPITEDSQRVVVAAALEDPKAFEGTLTKVIAMTGGAPKKREFQGATIYDFEIPEIPNAPNGGNQFKGPVSVTIAKSTVFISTDSSLLEQTLRGGGPALADSPSFQAVAKEIPDKSSSLSYVRPDESARLSYDMIKGGQFQKAIQGAAVAGGPDMSKLGKLFDKDKLPDFSVFAKYLSQGGGYSVQEEDGLTFTNFTLRKANP